jgi:FkbM family methyltransferase
MRRRYVKIAEHSVYLPAIRAESPCVLDLGANTGSFSHWAADFLAAKVYAVEALPELAQRLCSDSRINVLHAAVCGSSGTVLIYRSNDRCASLSLNPPERQHEVSVPAVTLEEICNQWGLDDIDLVKIDIEGSEIDVLSQCSMDRLKTITQITCEFHDFVDASQRPKIRSICERLASAGFACVPMATTTWGDTVFLNTSKIAHARLAQAEMYSHKLVSGARRAVAKAGRLLGVREVI